MAVTEEVEGDDAVFPSEEVELAFEYVLRGGPTVDEKEVFSVLITGIGEVYLTRTILENWHRNERNQDSKAFDGSNPRMINRSTQNGKWRNQYIIRR